MLCPSDPDSPTSRAKDHPIPTWAVPLVFDVLFVLKCSMTLPGSGRSAVEERDEQQLALCGRHSRYLPPRLVLSIQ
eukprot:853588-Rhodomonas_salina.4